VSRSSDGRASCSTGCWPKRSASAGARLHRQRRQVPPAGQPGPETRGNRRLPPVPRPAGRPHRPKVVVTSATSPPGSCSTRPRHHHPAGHVVPAGRHHARADLPPGRGPAGRRGRAGPDACRLRAGQAVHGRDPVSPSSNWPPPRPRTRATWPRRWPVCAGSGTCCSCPATSGPARRRSPRGSPGARHRGAGHQPDVHPRPAVRGGAGGERGAHAPARRRLPARQPRRDRRPRPRPARGGRGVALVEWGDAAAPVLGTGALSLLLEVDPDDEGRRRIAVTGAVPVGRPLGRPGVGPRPLGGRA